jgi:hypothetical protein
VGVIRLGRVATGCGLRPRRPLRSLRLAPPPKLLGEVGMPRVSGSATASSRGASEPAARRNDRRKPRKPRGASTAHHNMPRGTYPSAKADIAWSQPRIHSPGRRGGWALSGWVVLRRAVVCVRGAPSARLGSHLPQNCWGRLGCRGFQVRRRRLLVGRVNPPLAVTTAENFVNRAGLPRHTTTRGAAHTRRRRPTSRSPSREFIRLGGGWNRMMGIGRREIALATMLIDNPAARRHPMAACLPAATAQSRRPPALPHRSRSPCPSTAST